jgi:hypothetical protein
MKMLLLFSIISLAACAKSAMPLAQAEAAITAEANGNEGLNGGNFEAQELGRMSGELLSVIRLSQDLYPEVAIDALEKAIVKTKLFMVPAVVINGQELDASNNGTDTIQVSRIRWSGKAERNSRLALLFHEYLGILGLEKDNYHISNRLLNPVVKSPAGENFECDNYYGTVVKLRYDFTSSFFFFQAIGGSLAALDARNANSENTVKVTKEQWDKAAKESWQRDFRDGNRVQSVRYKSGDQLYRPGRITEPMGWSWQRMYFVDGPGFMLTTEKADDTVTCLKANSAE